jgi:hypothetical protein
MQVVMGMLEDEKLIQQWKGRFGMLGSHGGGFLPAQIVTSGMGSASGGVAGLAHADPESAAQVGPSTAATDSGDFCQFVQSSNFPTYVGVPSMLDLCPQIAELADISTIAGTEVLGASMASGGGWLLELQEQKGTKAHQHFDALVLATHNPSLASSIVQSIVDAELQAGSYTSVEDAIQQERSGDTLPRVMKRLSTLSTHLQQVRTEGRRPLYAIQVTYPSGFSESIPFDAVSVPGSPLLQFLVNEGSKPGDRSPNGDVWTGISTSQLATHVLDDKSMDSEKKKEHIQRVLTGEMALLMSPYFDNDESKVPLPTSVFVKQWGAAITGKRLDLEEDSITLSSWRLGICGDFIRRSSAYPTPWEAAALSGLEAGERMSSLYLQSL